MQWAAGSHDLSPLDFYLWGFKITSENFTKVDKPPEFTLHTNQGKNFTLL